MNRVQRRLWKIVVTACPTEQTADLVERLQRLVDERVEEMTPALRRVMQPLLSNGDDVDYPTLGRQIVKQEGVWISQAAIRKRVSRAMRLLEQAIRDASWDDSGSSNNALSRSQRSGVGS